MEIDSEQLNLLPDSVHSFLKPIKYGLLSSKPFWILFARCPPIVWVGWEWRLWQLNSLCGKACESIFGDFSDYFMSLWKSNKSETPSCLLPNNLCFLRSLLILPQTNVSTLADLWLWSRGVTCEWLRQHHWLSIHDSVYRCIPGRQRGMTKIFRKKKS